MKTWNKLSKNTIPQKRLNPIFPEAFMNKVCMTFFSYKVYNIMQKYQFLFFSVTVFLKEAGMAGKFLYFN